MVAIFSCTNILTVNFFISFQVLSFVTLTGTLASGIFQSDCIAVVVAFYVAVGFTFGTVTADKGIPAIDRTAGLGIYMADFFSV
jgi:hypothetical protein